MANKFFEDMVTVKRAKEARAGKAPERSVEKVTPSTSQHHTVGRESTPRNEIKVKRKPPEDDVPSDDNFSTTSRPRYMLWAVALVAVGFLFFSLSYLFSKAIVTINAKEQEVTLKETLSATKDSNNSDLSFHLVEITGEETEILETTEEEEVSERATGVAVIFNSFSTASQILSIDTRLEGTNGKIYKTLTRTTVPGMSSGGTPGSVEVEIYADQPGSSYNSSPMDFSIVGFKGTSKYTKFTVRSKGSISGGLSGTFPAISDDQKQKVLSDLKTRLETKLVKQATEQIPEGFILFKDAVFLNTNDNSISFAFSEKKEVPVKLTGTLYGLLFDKDNLTRRIAKNVITKYDDASVYIPNLENTTFTLSNKDDVSFSDVSTINFTLSGLVKIIWDVDEEKLTRDLLGLSKTSFNQTLLNYPNIDSATLVVSPFWKRSIPDEAKDVRIIINNK